MEKFKVRKGVPMPGWHAGGVKRYDWPFGTMKKGECFFVPLKDGSFKEIYGKRQTILRAAIMWRAAGRKFSTRLMPNDKAIGVWRVE